MTSQLQNLWHLRRVGEASSKPCDICYKPTTSVLITPDQKDYFYICLGHLKDRGFCTPVIDAAEAAAKKKKEELDREIELIKKEYEEKIKKRKKSKESKQKEKSSNTSKDDKAGNSNDNNKDEDEKAEKEKNDKVRQGITHWIFNPNIKTCQINALIDQGSTTTSEDGPRIFALQKYNT
ncbi:MAG: hypothetical protein Q9225_004184 [Loekoesia sp. 1 TL-2023]